MYYTNEERHELLLKFYRMDLNGDGVLSKKEIINCLDESHLPREKLDEFLSLFDMDGDDMVTLEEYERALGLREVPPTKKEDWRLAFIELDKDNSGTLSVQELRKGLRRSGIDMSVAHIKEIISESDKNGDGLLDIDEFYAFMRCHT